MFHFLPNHITEVYLKKEKSYENPISNRYAKDFAKKRGSFQVLTEKIVPKNS